MGTLLLLGPEEEKAVEHYNEGHWLLQETDCCLTRGPCAGSTLILLIGQQIVLLPRCLRRVNIHKSFPREGLLPSVSGHFGEHAHEPP